MSLKGRSLPQAVLPYLWETTDFKNAILNGENLELSVVRGKRECEQWSVSQEADGFLAQGSPTWLTRHPHFSQASSTQGSLRGQEPDNGSGIEWKPRQDSCFKEFTVQEKGNSLHLCRTLQLAVVWHVVSLDRHFPGRREATRNSI